MKYFIILPFLTLLFSCQMNNSKKNLEKTKFNQSKILKNNHEKISFENNKPNEEIKADSILKFKERVKILLELTDSTSMPDYFASQRDVDSINNNFDNSHRSALAAEKYLIKNNPFNNVKKDSIGLFLKINGYWKLFEPNPNNDEADLIFEHYFKEFGYYSIYVQWGEGNGYKIINEETGEVQNLYGRPYFSPTGKYMISISGDIIAQYSANGFELFKTENNSLRYLGNFDPEDWEPSDLKWMNNHEFILEGMTYNFNDTSNSFFYLKGMIKE